MLFDIAIASTGGDILKFPLTGLALLELAALAWAKRRRQWITHRETAGPSFSASRVLEMMSWTTGVGSPWRVQREAAALDEGDHIPGLGWGEAFVSE